MKKRIFSILLSLCLVMTLLPATALAEKSEELLEEPLTEETFVEETSSEEGSIGRGGTDLYTEGAGAH